MRNIFNYTILFISLSLYGQGTDWNSSYYVHAKKMGVGDYRVSCSERINGIINQNKPFIKVVFDSINYRFKPYFSNSFFYSMSWLLTDTLQYRNKFPAILYNSTTDTIGIGSTIQEAKQNGNWKPIEYCSSTCNAPIPILPISYVTILCPRYSGSEKVVMRVKIETDKGILISNEFYGSINKNQFKAPKKNKLDGK